MIENIMREAYEMSKNGDYESAIALYREIYKKNPKTFKNSCKYYYMWAAYKGIIAKENSYNCENKDRTQRFVDYILNNTKNDELIFKLTIFSVLKYLKSNEKYSCEKKYNYLKQLDFQNLSDESQTYKSSGKNILVMSHKEKWFSEITKTCFELEFFEECIEFCNIALKELSSFHNNNNIWFMYRIAKSNMRLGNKQESLFQLLEIAKRKKNWFIYKEIAEAYKDKEDVENEFLYLVKASIQADGEEKSKVNIYLRLASMLLEQNEIESYNILMKHILKIRINENWKLSNLESDFYEKNKVEIDSSSSNILKKDVVNLIKVLRYKNMEVHTGTISKIINSKSGFIKDEDKQYYFIIKEVMEKNKNVILGQKVNFYIEKSFDNKRNKESFQAVNITFKKE